MIVTVTTLLDTPERAARFARRNLARGADHVFVFLDAQQQETREALLAEGPVTVVPTHAGWWCGGEDVVNLNDRQAMNASTLNVVLAELGWVRWMIHIDGDEVLDIDRRKLRHTPPEVPTTRLRVLEAVGQEADGTGPLLFKRPVGEQRIEQARRDGLISADKLWFRGHRGKTAVRPTLDLAVNVHGARCDDGTRAGWTHRPWVRLLHLETTTLDAFVTKWRRLLAADRINVRPERRAFGAEVEAALRLPAHRRGPRLRELMTEADVLERAEDLLAAGLLESVDVDQPRYAPRTVPDAHLQATRDGLAAAAHLDKSVLRVGPRSRREAELARRARGR